MLGAYVAYTAIDRLGPSIGFWPSALLACLAVAAIGALVEMTILRRIYDAPELFQLLATFGVTLAVEDLVLLIWGPGELLGPRAPGFKGAVAILGQPFPTYDLLLIALAPSVLIALWVLVPAHALGRAGARGDAGSRDGGGARRQPEMAVHQRLRARRFPRRASAARSRCRARRPATTWICRSSRSRWSSSSSAGSAACPARFSPPCWSPSSTPSAFSCCRACRWRWPSW